MARQVLLSPGSVQSFASARHPSALPNGVNSVHYDLRLDDGTVRTRWGNSLIRSDIQDSYTFRGCFEATFNGVPTLFWAGRDAGKTIIAKSTDVGLTWSVMTLSSGPYGDTRFSSEGWVHWAVVSQAGIDYLVIQNGVDPARVWNGTWMEIIGTTQRPAVTGSYVAGFPKYSTFNNNPTVTSSNTAKMSGNLRSNGNGSYIEVVVKTTVTSSESVVVDPLFDRLGGAMTVPFVPAKTGQFVWLLDDSTEQWRGLKIEASEYTGGVGPWRTIYNPSSDNVVSGDGSGTSVLAAGQMNDRLGGLTMSSLRLSWTGDAPSSNLTIKFYAIGYSGGIYGGAGYAASFSSEIYRGPGTVLPERDFVISGIIVPRVHEILYQYTISVFLPTGYVGASLYRREVGTSAYYYFDGLGGATGTTVILADGIPNLPLNTPVDLTKPLPRADTIALPVGTAMASVNGRLFVASKNRLYYSESGKPFAFALTVRFDGTNADPDSAGSFLKSGETFNAIVAVGSVDTGAESLGTPRSGAISVYPVTDRFTYILSGFDAVSLNKTTRICIGSRSPFSFETTSGGFYFLDSEGQIRGVFGTESKALSKFVVDDQTKGIPDSLVAMAWGAYLDGRYRLAYARPGDLQNTRILVYNESLGFESIDRPFSPPPMGLLPYYDSSESRVRILGFGGTNIDEIEKPGELTDPTGQAITPEIRFGELRNWPMATKAREAILVADVDATGTFNVSYQGTTGTRLSPLSLGSVSMEARNAGETRIIARTVTNLGLNSLTIQPTLALSTKGGSRVYYFELNTMPGTDAVTP